MAIMADINGTNNNDTVIFQGEVAHYTAILTNPYSGYSVFIDEDKNVNMLSYDGLSGFDTLAMSLWGDVLILDDMSVSPIANIERIQAGRGGDVIHLASTTRSIGSIEVQGAGNDDIIWTNIGDDTLLGATGNDILDGGPGHDIANGQEDNDIVSGGIGNDVVLGGTGNDVLQYVADSLWPAGVDLDSLGSGLPMAATISLENYNRSHDVFDGGPGYDTLLLTGGNDALFLHDTLSDRHSSAASMMRVSGVEEIHAGEGDDIVDFSMGTYGAIIVDGGEGNDIIAMSSGEDTVYGGDDDDIIHGGQGADDLLGESGSDVIYGGLHDDRIDGGDGDDILYGGNNDLAIILDKDFSDPILFPGVKEGTHIKKLKPPGDPALGVVEGNLSVDFEASASITFRKGYAGFDNTLGAYAIAADGSIVDAKIYWANVKTAGVNIVHHIDLPIGADGGNYGFFIVANGNTVNGGYAGLNLSGDGVLQFVYNYGKADARTANITDNGKDITLVYDDGVKEKALKGFVYHTTERGGDTGLNWDGKTHVISGSVVEGNTETLRVGFEDLPMLGDADFEDVLFDLDINEVSIDNSEVGNDVLIGGIGNDTLYGEGGNDMLVVGAGLDQIHGGSGSDVIVYNFMDDLADRIYGFERGSGGDSLNITDILEGYDPGVDTLNDFVRLSVAGGNTEVRVNADGDVGGVFTAIAVIMGGVGGQSIADLVSNGNMVLDQSVTV